MSYKARKPVPQAKRDAQYTIFGRLVLTVGGACVAAALFYNSVIPLVVGVVGLYCTLSFMTGLGG
jgi:hypothetical protein